MQIDIQPITADPLLKKLGIHQDEYRHDYDQIAKDLQKYIELGDEASWSKTIRWMTEEDFFFFCYFVLELPVNHPFLLARIYDAQDLSHMTIDLWAREHWKSTILTFALPIWEIIRKPESRICIFSHTRAIAKSHLRKIKEALEQNIILHDVFSDIFYSKPKTEAMKWSEDEGLYIKGRKKNWGEASFEAWGLVDSMPTGKHYTHRIYDDIIDTKNVNTPDQIRKATSAFKESDNLGARGGIKRVIGTRYSHKDTYGEIMKDSRWIQRIYPAEVDEEGKRKREGIPVYLTPEELDAKFTSQGEYIYSCQMLQDPVAESEQGFKPIWIRYSNNRPALNYYVLVDPASTKKRESDYTVMSVIGTDYLKNYWLVDMVRDKLSLGERWKKLRELVVKWQCLDVGYERYGMQSDIEYMHEQMEREGIFFNIVELGGLVAKTDRIKRLVPLFQFGRFILPRVLPYTDINKITHDLILEFIEEEYSSFPYSKHDDMLDCMARITDSKLNVIFPTDSGDIPEIGSDPLNIYEHENPDATWMSA